MTAPELELQTEADLTSCQRCLAPTRPGQRFCTRCGSPLAVRAPERRASGAPRSTAAEVIRARLASRARLESVREAYFELGLQLLKAGRAARACDALEAATNEAGTRPNAADAFVALAQAYLETKANDRALRAFLEAVLAEPSSIGDLLPAAYSVLTGDAAIAQSRWFVDEWLPRSLRAVNLDSQRALLHVLAGAFLLMLGDETHAFEQFNIARGADANAALDAVEKHFAMLPLPLNLVAGEGERDWLLARIISTLGFPRAALERVERALEIGFVQRTGYPDAPVRALRGELLRELDRPKEAALNLREAGDRYNWRNEPEEAVRLLEDARKVDQESVEVCWSLSNALLSASYGRRLDKPARQDLLRRAQDTWQQGYAARRPREWDAWAYATGAYIVVQKAVLQGTPESIKALWEAATYIERALLLTPYDATRWSNLAEFERRLMNWQNALICARRGHDCDSKDSEPLSELVVILTNVGDWSEASEALEKLEMIGRTAWSASVAARLHLYGGRAETALARIDDALSSDPHNLGYLGIKSLILRRLGRWSESLEIAQAIVSRFNVEDTDNLGVYGWCALECREPTLAVKAFEGKLPVAGNAFELRSAKRDLALARLANNEVVTARALFTEGTAGGIDPEMRWLQLRDIDDLDALAKQWPASEHLSPVLGEFRHAAEAQPPLPMLSARAELEAAMTTAPQDDTPGSWQRVGALAGLARIDLNDHKFSSAAQRYVHLAQWPDLFPEASLGGARAFNLEGNARYENGDYSTAVENYMRAIELVPDDAVFHSNLALGLERIETPGKRYEELGKAIESLRKAAQLEPDESDYKKRLASLETRQHLVARYGEVTLRDPVSTPVVVEIGQGLVPKVDPKLDEGRFLHNLVPAMRDRIQEKFGVTLPGVRMRLNTMLPADSYVIMINEIPHSTGAIAVGRVFCALTTERQMIEPNIESAFDPLTDVQGFWLDDADQLKSSTNGNATCFADVEMLIRHIEAVLQHNLEQFFGIQESETLLSTWSADETLSSLVRAALPDDSARLGFARLLRTLVREQIPIVSGREILSAIQGKRLSPREIADAIRAVRVRLKAYLPGNYADAKRIELSDELESTLKSCFGYNHGVETFDIPPEVFHISLNEIRHLFSLERRRTLVVQSPELRPYVQRMVDFLMPPIRVLASEEVIT